VAYKVLAMPCFMCALVQCLVYQKKKKKGTSGVIDLLEYDGFTSTNYVKYPNWI